MLRPRHGMLILALGIGILGCQPNVLAPDTTDPSTTTSTKPKATATPTPAPGSTDSSGDPVTGTPTPTPFNGAGVIDFYQLPTEGGPSPFSAVIANYCLYMPAATDSDWPDSFTYSYAATSSNGTIMVRALRPELIQKGFEAGVSMNTGNAPPPVALTMSMADPAVAPIALTIPALDATPSTYVWSGEFLAKCPELAGVTITTQTASEETSDGVRANGIRVLVKMNTASSSAEVFRQLVFTATGDNLATASMRLTISNEGYLPIIIQ